MHPSLATLYRSLHTDTDPVAAVRAWQDAGFPGLRGVYRVSGVVEGCCLVARCTARPHGRGLCRRHYAEAEQAGTLDLYPRTRE